MVLYGKLGDMLCFTGGIQSNAHPLLGEPFWVNPLSPSPGGEGDNGNEVVSKL